MCASIHSIDYFVYNPKQHAFVNKSLAQEMLGQSGLGQYLSALGHGQGEHDEKKIWEDMQNPHLTPHIYQGGHQSA